jgi:hypothetical protein
MQSLKLGDLNQQWFRLQVLGVRCYGKRQRAEGRRQEARGLLCLLLVRGRLSRYSKRQRAKDRRQKGKDWLVKVSAFHFVLIALATAINLP